MPKYSCKLISVCIRKLLLGIKRLNLERDLVAINCVGAAIGLVPACLNKYIARGICVADVTKMKGSLFK